MVRWLVPLGSDSDTVDWHATHPDRQSELIINLRITDANPLAEPSTFHFWFYANMRCKDEVLRPMNTIR